MAREKAEGRRERSLHAACAAALISAAAGCSTGPVAAGDGPTLTVVRTAAAPAEDDETVIVRQTQQNMSGNTRFRYYPAAARMSLDAAGNLPVRPEAYAAASYPDAHRFRLRDRDLGQIFTVPAEARGAMFLDAITLRAGPDALANEGGAHGARVSMQLFEVSGTARIHDNGTAGDQPARWDTYDPDRAHTDDYVTGQTFTPLQVASGGILPDPIGQHDYMRWELDGPRLRLEPGRQYAFLLMFDEPGVRRGLAIANQNNASTGTPGPYEGGHGIRRDGSSTRFEDVFFRPRDAAGLEQAIRGGTFEAHLASREPDERDDIERALASSIMPADAADRQAIAPGTIGYPDVDTYRDLVFFVHVTTER